MTDQLLQDLASNADAELDTAGAFERRVVSLILRFFKYPVPGVDKQTLAQFHKDYDFPVSLAVRKIQADPGDFLLRFNKTKIWKEYISLVSSYGGSKVGLIFPCCRKIYVLHNAVEQPVTPGHVCFTVQAAVSDYGSRFEPLASFLSGVGW